ncbi:MAG: hypothetical protein ACE5ES_01925 [Candidatus Nanoarchaeia archaeon]
MSKAEEKLYPEIEEWLKKYLQEKYIGYSIETTYETSRRNLDAFLRDKNIKCKESIGLGIKVDIVGILKRGDKFEFVFVEVKDKPLTLKDLGQLWGYTQLINPKESFLISPKGLGTLNYIFNVLKRQDLLRYGNNSNKYMKLAKWNKRRKWIDNSTLMPKI